MSGTTCADALRAAAQRLEEAGIEGARQDARWLLAEALGTLPDAMAGRMADGLEADALAGFEGLVSRRVAREPMSHILGRRAFFGREFDVCGDVLDPRPETEAIVERVLAGPAPKDVLDLGTGSGALLVSLLAEMPEATGVGTDVSVAALGVARGNAARHGVAARAEFVVADWLMGCGGPYDLVVCNPPYIPTFERETLSPEVREFEPALALFGGADGLDAYRQIAGGLAEILRPKGRAIFEFGLGQEADVARIFETVGFAEREILPDISGRARFVEILG